MPDPIIDDKSKDKDKGAPDLAAQIADLVKRNAELDAKLEALKKPDPKDEDLLDKSRKSRESDDKKQNDSKALERAITFNLKAKDFVDTNRSLLPKDIPDIFAQAEKENYSNAIEKDAAIKAGIVQSFFSIQSNVDLLTQGLKSSLDEYLKLTKDKKQEQGPAMYDAVFEPAFEMLKRIKKAEALGKGHASDDGDVESKYRARLIEQFDKRHNIK